MTSFSYPKLQSFALDEFETSLYLHILTLSYYDLVLGWSNKHIDEKHVNSTLRGNSMYFSISY